ncbi:MAG: hypothetical protein WAK31_17735 [Chthoniobacterales bacterium]
MKESSKFKELVIPGVFVIVLVLEDGGTFLKRVTTQRLEGSRFGAYLGRPRDISLNISPDRNVSKAGGSRERPRGLQFYLPGWVMNRSHKVDALRWIIPGSRLLLACFWPNRTLEQISRGRE